MWSPQLSSGFTCVWKKPCQLPEMSLDTGKQLLLVTPLALPQEKEQNDFVELPLICTASPHRLAAFSNQQYQISGLIQQIITLYYFSLAKATKDSVSTVCYPETSVIGIKLLATSQLMLDINFCQPD